ncbi:MAG: DUF370 domain-containing protein [Clostridia bacterium]|nr:DUF370 domain-containing protein [Clostridia bacterium]
MFLHIGNGVSVRQRDIIGIFDLDTATVSAETKRFLRSSEKKGLLEDVANGEIPRSFLLLDQKKDSSEKGSYQLKLSLISSAALKLRLLRLSEDADE